MHKQLKLQQMNHKFYWNLHCNFRTLTSNQYTKLLIIMQSESNNVVALTTAHTNL